MSSLYSWHDMCYIQRAMNRWLWMYTDRCVPVWRTGRYSWSRQWFSGKEFKQDSISWWTYPPICLFHCQCRTTFSESGTSKNFTKVPEKVIPTLFTTERKKERMDACKKVHKSTYFNVFLIFAELLFFYTPPPRWCVIGSLHNYTGRTCSCRFFSY